VMLPEDRNPQSRVMEYHNKQVEGTERLFRYQAAHYPVTGRWDDFLFKGQLVQAEALKCAVEHWRRRKFRTGGALFWQLNDCWPVTSWSVIDCDLRPKAGYYYARRFYAPVLVSFARTDSHLEVWGTNDSLAHVNCRLSLCLLSVTGVVLWRKALRVGIPANASHVLFALPAAPMRNVEPASTYLRAELFDGARRISENRYYLLEPKHLALPPARIRLAIREKKRGVFEATVQSKALALGVALSATRGDPVFHDNFFDLDPGSEKTVLISSALSLAALRRVVKVRALNSQHGIK
jgi:beta-mannosidase